MTFVMSGHRPRAARAGGAHTLRGVLDIGPYTTLRLGGPARRLVTAVDQQEIVQSVRDAAKLDEPLLVLAGGSNVVIADAGFDGTVLLVRSTGIRIEERPAGTALLTAAAGQPWDEVVRASLAAGLAGLECLSGIPGSAGATPIQNVGAYGHEVAEVLHEVPVYDRVADEVLDFTPEQCRLGFRTSLFRRNDRYVVLAVTFRLRHSPLSAPVQYAELARTLGVPVGDQVPAQRVREAVLALRGGKGMVLDPGDPDTYSVGSFFQNPVLDPDDYAGVRAAALATAGGEPPSWPYQGRVKVSAAWLIERAGFGKGYTGGHPGVGISTKHTLALTNRGAGTSAALLGLAREIRDGVRATFGVRLEPEAVLVGAEL
jgi:UDP-N-acetylmuramate dehydrogenase